MLLFHIRSGRAALPLDHVVETMRVLPIEHLARTPSYIAGLSIVRGEPVPVVDLGLLLDGDPVEASRLILVRVGERPVALAVESVAGVQEIDPSTMNGLPPLLGDAAEAAISSIGTRDAGLLLLLEACRLVPESVLQSLGAGAFP